MMTAACDRLLLLTDSSQTPRPLLAQLDAAVTAGVRQIVLREKHWPAIRRRALARQLQTRLAPLGGRVIVADPSWPVDACHLSADFAVPRPRPALVGRSRHHGEPISSAVDYISYSPVFDSASKPGYGPARGEAELAEVCRTSPVPVYALGGIATADHAARARAAGAYGVAVMGEVMRSADPAALVADLLRGCG